MKRAASFIGAFVLILAVALGLWYWLRATPSPSVAPASKDDLIVVDSPLPGAAVSSPFTVAGKARGPWFFEAQFPVKIYDSDGRLLASTPAHAQGDWMTEEYVPFIAELAFAYSTTATGTLVLERDNPSGRPEMVDQLVIPIRFSAMATSTPVSGTRIKLYYYDPLRDQGPGGAQCSAAGLVAVERVIPKTSTPLKDSVELLLRSELTDAEIQEGLISEFPLEGVVLTKTVVQNGVATLTFADPQHKTSGDSCGAAIMWKEIEATAKQFGAVQSVEFEPKDLFQP